MGDIDISWIDDDQELYKSSMQNIQIVAVYITEDNAIQTVVKNKCILDISSTATKGSILPTDKLLYMIHKLKVPPNQQQKKYRLQEILIYNLDSLETNLLKHIDQELLVNNPLQSITNYTNTNHIHIPQSLEIFHDINCLYMIFQEIEFVQEPKKPAIKIHDIPAQLQQQHKKTKKVSFKDDLYRHTRKRDISV